MIVGKDFIWLHFPKCGGVSTELALRTLLKGRRDVAFDSIDHRSGIWHDTIPKRQERNETFDPAGKRIFCGIRRLPHWILSLTHFEIARGERATTREMLLQGRVFNSQSSLHADELLAGFSLPEVNIWIRTEYLAADLATAFALPLDRVQSSLKMENAGTMDYVRELSFWFTSRELAGLYDANPLWADLERRVYGSLIELA